MFITVTVKTIPRTVSNRVELRAGIDNDLLEIQKEVNQRHTDNVFKRTMHFVAGSEANTTSLIRATSWKNAEAAVLYHFDNLENDAYNLESSIDSTSRILSGRYEEDR